jgi:hypothetical protein
MSLQASLLSLCGRAVKHLSANRLVEYGRAERRPRVSKAAILANRAERDCSHRRVAWHKYPDQQILAIDAVRRGGGTGARNRVEFCKS